MISLKVEEYCQNCSHFNPIADVSTVKLETLTEKDVTIYNNTIVSCVDAGKCKNMYEELKKRTNS